jgi:hypothetical protein
MPEPDSSTRAPFDGQEHIRGKMILAHADNRVGVACVIHGHSLELMKRPAADVFVLAIPVGRERTSGLAHAA